MRLVYCFSLCLIAGMVCSQLFDFESYRHYLYFFSDIGLAYILMEVGLDLMIDKKQWKKHLWDYWVAAIAAGLPWIFCFVYLLYRTDQPWSETLLISRFAAPTASGVLDPMLVAAGLGATWLFRKVRVLTILDDIDTILVMIPLQLLLMRTRYELLFVMLGVIALVGLAWRYLHQLKFRAGRTWLLFYAMVLAILLREMELWFHIDIEILLPAFVWGCLLYNPYLDSIKGQSHNHIYLRLERKSFDLGDRSIKFAFMFLVGLLLPKLQVDAAHVSSLIMDALLLTLLSCLGKCVLIFCCQKEATLNERIAAAMSMSIRGELGVGILLIAIERGIGGYATTVAGLSLTLNFLLTGVFMTIVVRLVNGKNKRVGC